MMDPSKLTYSVNEKTVMILELKAKLDDKKNLLILLSGISSILIFYIIFSNNKYVSSAASYFKKTNIKTSFIDNTIIFILLISIICIYKLLTNYKKIKGSYENLRKDLIKTINSEFCTCKNTCTCKYDYLNHMKNKGIDLDLM